MSTWTPRVLDDEWRDYEATQIVKRTDPQINSITSGAWDVQALDMIESIAPPTELPSENTSWDSRAQNRIDALSRQAEDFSQYAPQTPQSTPLQTTRPLSLGSMFGLDQSAGMGNTDVRADLPELPTNLEAGTPEGDATLGRLSQIAAEQTPGGRIAQGYLGTTFQGPGGTADTPIENIGTMVQGALTPISMLGDVGQAGAKAILDRTPGGTTIPDWARNMGIREDTPILGGALQHDIALPMAIGMLAPGPNDVQHLAEGGLEASGKVARNVQEDVRAAGGVKPYLERGVINLEQSKRLRPEGQIGPRVFMASADGVEQMHPLSAQTLIDNIPGMQYTQDGILVGLNRYQQQYQEGEASMRGGVFYKAGDPSYNTYKGAFGKAKEGGDTLIQGPTYFHNPLLFLGTPYLDPAAHEYLGYDLVYSVSPIIDAGFKAKRAGNLDLAFSHYTTAMMMLGVPEDEAKAAADSLTKFIDNNASAHRVVNEHALGSKARSQGYDAVIGLQDNGTRSPYVEELMDLRESAFPSPHGGFELHPDYAERLGDRNTRRYGDFSASKPDVPSDVGKSFDAGDGFEWFGPEIDDDLDNAFSDFIHNKPTTEKEFAQKLLDDLDFSAYALHHYSNDLLPDKFKTVFDDFTHMPAPQWAAKYGVDETKAKAELGVLVHAGAEAPATLESLKKGLADDPKGFWDELYQELVNGTQFPSQSLDAIEEFATLHAPPPGADPDLYDAGAMQIKQFFLNNEGNYNGQKFWGGVYDSKSGKILETVSQEFADMYDFDEHLMFSSKTVDALENKPGTFFFNIENGKIVVDPAEKHTVSDLGNIAQQANLWKHDAVTELGEKGAAALTKAAGLDEAAAFSSDETVADAFDVLVHAIGHTPEEATDLLKKAGFEVGSASTRFAGDLAAGVAGGTAGYSTSDPGDTPYEKFKRAALGAAAGVAGAEGVRAGANFVRGRLAPTPPPTAPPVANPSVQESVGEAWDRTNRMFQQGVQPRSATTNIEKTLSSMSTRIASLWDNTAPIRKVQEEVYRGFNHPLSVEEDAALQIRLQAGRGAAAAERVQQDLFPIVKDLTENERNGLSTYMALLDNADKYQSVLRRDGQAAADARLFPGTVHFQDTAAIDAELERRVGPQMAARIRDAADQLSEYNQQLRDRLHDSGIISDDVYDLWTREFPHYVRTDIAKYIEDGLNTNLPQGRPALTVNQLRQAALSTEGTEDARLGPMHSLIRQTFSTEALVRRNDAARAILEMRRIDPELQQLIKQVPSNASKAANEVYFTVYENGDQLRFVAPKTIEGLFNIDAPNIPGWARFVSTIGLAPVLRAGATGVNLAFLLPNAIRDAQTYMRRTGGFTNPKQFGTSAAALGRAYVDVVRDFHNPDWSQALKMGAGQFSEFSSLSTDQMMRRLLKEGALGGRVRPVKTTEDLVKAIGDVIALPFDPIRRIGEKIETAPRLATYRLERAKGVAPERAALAAREVTMDFSRAGNFARVANTFLPFFNAAMQGSERFVTKDLAKGNRLNTTIGLTTSVILPTLAAEAWNRNFYAEDYADVPDYLKDTGFVLMLPIEPANTSEGTRGQRPFIWIPRPQDVNFLSALTTRTFEQVIGDNERGWDDVLNSIWSSMSPVDTENLPLPPTLKTGAELISNYDMFRRRPIVPEGKQDFPSAEQKNPETSALGRAVGRTFNVSPIKADYAVSAIGGGTGRQLLRMSDTVARALGIESAEPARYPPVTDLPLVRDVSASLLRNAGGQRVVDANRNYDTQYAQIRQNIIDQLKALPEWKTMNQRQRDEAVNYNLDRITRDFNRMKRESRQILTQPR